MLILRFKKTQKILKYIIIILKTLKRSEINILTEIIPKISNTITTNENQKKKWSKNYILRKNSKSIKDQTIRKKIRTALDTTRSTRPSEVL